MTDALPINKTIHNIKYQKMINKLKILLTATTIKIENYDLMCKNFKTRNYFFPFK